MTWIGEFLIRLTSKIFNINLLGLALSIRGIGQRNSMSENGEERFLSKVLPRLLTSEPVVFDVGANRGNYSSLIRRGFPKATIHSFEPQLEAAQLVRNRFAGDPNFFIHSFGLSDFSGERVLFFDHSTPMTSHATLYESVYSDIHQKEDIKSISCDFRTLEDICRELKIDHIDFLKIDTEGHELSVLKGAENFLKHGRISAIQFEFNEMNIISKTFLRNFYDLLYPSYSFFRLTSNSLLPLHEYSPKNEIFIIQNIVCLHASLLDKL